MNLHYIKDRIELMPKHYQIEISRILIEQNKISYNENQNGIFINLSNLPHDIISKIENYINYVNLQESQINQTELQKDELKDKFFK
jgi:hypothetical protein